MKSLQPAPATKTVLEILSQDPNGIVAKLFQNDYQPDDVSTPASFVESTFPGYQEQASIFWERPPVAADGAAATVVGQATFTRDEGPGSETVHGLYLLYRDGVNPPRLIGADRFKRPLTVNTAGQRVVAEICDVAKALPDAQGSPKQLTGLFTHVYFGEGPGLPSREAAFTGKFFYGDDRRLLQSIRRVLESAALRDSKAAGKKGSRGVAFFSLDDLEFHYCLQTVVDRVNFLLDQ